MNIKKIKKIIAEYNLTNRDDVINFIKNYKYEYSLEELTSVAELINNSRVETSAYYTDEFILNNLTQHLPDIEKDVIRILEPSVGVGNFLQLIVDKYSTAKKLIIDLNDMDSKSLEILKILNELRTIPENVEINYFNEDFLNPMFNGDYDLIIGNPPFSKLNAKSSKFYKSIFQDNITKNLSGFFLQKAVYLAKHVLLIMPKYFLSNDDFSLTRKVIENKSIRTIVDFGEKGFKGVLIETIAISLCTNESPTQTLVENITFGKKIYQDQIKIIDHEYPYWLIYRNDYFDRIASNMLFDVFTVYRDRQLTNRYLSDKGDVWVVKSRNIKRDGSKIEHLNGYDAYISEECLKNFNVSKYYHRDDVYLAPNMTYYPRVVKKPSKCITNGSVAILENQSPYQIKEKHLEFLSSVEFEKFYRIARNYSTRSLNIDRNSIFFFGLYN